METSAKSYWLQDALGAEGEIEVEPLAGDRRCDVCIVGGGFTGLWTALRLKELEPSLDVVVIEKDLCGSGASGRNGGFCMTWASKFSTLVKLCGAQEGVRLMRASEQGVKDIGAFCERNGIDAHFRLDGWLWTATSQTQIGSWEQTIEDLERYGAHPFELVTPEEVARRTGSQENLAGIFEAGIATVQPARLARGLRRVALANGVRVHEHTAMTELARTRPPRVHTSRGTITADKVVLGLNAWSAEMPEFRRWVLPIASDVVTTEPVPERLAEIGLSDGVAVSDSRMLVNYYRTTLDGRLTFGLGGRAFAFAGRVRDRFDGQPAGIRDVTQALRRFYPALADVPIAEYWRGPATRTATGLPFFGRLERAPAIVYGHGYTGNGVGPSYMGGRILASLALDRDDEWSSIPLANGPVGRPFPPEPVRYVGAHIVRAAVQRKEAAEDSGRRPGRLDVALTGFAPAGLVPVKKR